VSACAFCGLPAAVGDRRPSGSRRARLDLAPQICADCATLDPERPGAALRAAARVLGVPEEDPYLHEALKAEAGALDGLLFADPGDPLRSGRRSPQREPWAHVPERTMDALRRAQARGLELWVLADRAQIAPAEAGPPSGPPGCLLCGVGTSAWWRHVLTAALTSGPGHVEGHLCAACSVAHDRVGAVGPTLVEQAYMGAAGVTWPAGVRPPAVRPWVATGLPPGEPWIWVDLRPPEPCPTVEQLAAQVAELRAEVGALRGRAAQ
jgi:hypothetical protein